MVDPETKNKKTLRLTLDVEFSTNAVDVEELKSNLRRVADNGASNGLFTGETDAEVESWNAEIAELPDSKLSDS